MYKDLVLHDFYIPDKDIQKICELSSHWLKKMKLTAAIVTRERIYNNLLRQERKKLHFSNTLRNFAYRVIDLLNSKYTDARIAFEIEE